MSIAKNIAVFRKRKGLTQAELGQKIGVTNQAVSKWESETYMPDVLMLPLIADALEITLDDLFSERTYHTSPPQSHVFNTDAIHSFPKYAQSMVIDSLCHQTNLLNCGTCDFLKVKQNPSTKKYDRFKQFTTLCCLSDTAGAAFVSDDLTLIDSGMAPIDISSIFEKNEIASGIKKLSDKNARLVLSHICNEYFHRSAPFNSKDPEYFVVNVDPTEISHSVGLPEDDIQEALEKLISLHIVDLRTDNGTYYQLHKVKAIEAAVTFRLIKRLIHNEVAIGCGEFLTLEQF